MNLCGACGLDFGSVSAFDAHRVGVHEYTYLEGMARGHRDGRRCLDVKEIRGSSKFTLNERGVWSLSRDLQRARTRKPLSGKRHV